MTPERAKELLPIIQAFSESKRIEWFEAVVNTWHYTNDPSLNDNIRYRIAPEPKKKVKMWMAVSKYEKSSCPSVNGSFYSSEEEARRMIGDAFLCLAPWSEIEVEVDDE